MDLQLSEDNRKGERLAGSVGLQIKKIVKIKGQCCQFINDRCGENNNGEEAIANGHHVRFIDT